MAFFDFLADLGYEPPNVGRMNLRHRHIIEPHLQDLEGARVLDLGAHDGRWAHALAGAGAASVLGIEGRAELIEKYAEYPETYRERVELIQGDFIVEMDRLITEGRTFDVIACLGVYYHTMQHYRMLLQMAALKPKLIVIDSLFEPGNRAVVLLTSELTSKRLNSIAQTEGQEKAPVGRVSIPALQMMSNSISFDLETVPWQVAVAERKPVMDYYAQGTDPIRRTVTLRPSAAAPSSSLGRLGAKAAALTRRIRH